MIGPGEAILEGPAGFEDQFDLGTIKLPDGQQVLARPGGAH
jgi:hypothetical protein